MRCAICGKPNHILTSSLCLPCYLAKQTLTPDHEPLYPGDVVEVIKADSNQGLRGFVMSPPSPKTSTAIWVRLKASRDEQPQYVAYARDDVKLFSRMHTGRSARL